MGKNHTLWINRVQKINIKQIKIMKTITKLGLAVILFMATAVSNHAQAQTKEETIAWIKKKLDSTVAVIILMAMLLDIQT